MDPFDFTQRLLPGEKIMWSGQPAQGLMLTGRDWLLIPFSLLWGGFAVFWESTVIATPAPIFMRLWGVPFVLVGLYLIVGRFAFDAWIRRGMAYAVTNKRILIARSAPFARFTAMSLDQIPDANLSERPDGRGTIRFGQESPAWGGRRGGFSSWTPALDPTPQFIGIENARSVFDQIQRSALPSS
jgi:hypothetical protein